MALVHSRLVCEPKSSRQLEQPSSVPALAVRAIRHALSLCAGCLAGEAPIAAALATAPVRAAMSAVCVSIVAACACPPVDLCGHALAALVV